MTWFRVGGGGSGIPAALKNRMNAVLNKKFGSAVDYPPNDWPDDVNLLGLLEVKTEAGTDGEITIYDSALDVPAISLMARYLSVISSGGVLDIPYGGELGESRTYDIDFGQNIRGASFDVVNGTGIITHSYVLFTGESSENWQWSQSGTKQRVFIDLPYHPAINTNTFVSNMIDPASGAIGYPNEYEGWVNSGGRIVIGVPSSIDSASAWKQYLTLHPLQITYEVDDAYKTDFTFDPVEILMPDGENFFAPYRGIEYDSLTYRSIDTIQPASILNPKTITENGVYQASADGADGFDVVTVNVPEIPSGDLDDPLGIIQSNYSRLNVSNLYSAYYIENGAIKKEIVFQMATGTGYEGFCIPIDALNLTDGKQYELSFVLDVPNTVTFSGSYSWGIKYSGTRVPSSGSAGTSTFNLTPDVGFLEQTGTQNVTLTFTAGASNYIVVLLARIAGSVTSWIKMHDIEISEVTI